jgi:hypothetical protein
MPRLDHLSADQRSALDGATSFVEDRYTPWAILAAGTIVRGESDPNSDIDLYVLHDSPFRQRVQRRFAGVPVEIFVNTEASVSGYLKSEEANGHLSTAHMLATGVALKGGSDPRLGKLRERARSSLSSRPTWTELDLIRERYAAATQIEDAIDRLRADPETAMRLLGRGVDASLSYWYKKQGVFIPRQKEIVARVVEHDGELDRLFRQFWGDHPYSARWEAGMEVADRILGTRGFFEWESEREPIASSV